MITDIVSNLLLLVITLTPMFGFAGYVIYDIIKSKMKKVI